MALSGTEYVRTIHDPGPGWKLPPAGDLDDTGCLVLMAAVIVSGKRDPGFIFSDWFVTICDFMSWDATWVAHRIQNGHVCRDHDLARVGRRGLQMEGALMS